MTTRASVRKTRSSVSANNDSPTDKEIVLNGKVQESKPSLTKPKSKASAKARAPKVYCTCRQPDDGSPMIFCAECKEWYHFHCVDLKDADADEIRVYICPTCSEKTGLHTVMEWEGPEALEEPAPAANPTSSQSSKPIPEPQQKDGSGLKEEPEEAEESPDDDSGDDYVADTAKSKGKRRAHQLSIISDPESGSDEDMKKAPKRLRRGSAVTIKEVKVPKEKSPGPSQAKRRPSTSSPSVPPKRKHSESTTGEDATRKYCTTKLQEVFSQIFTRYPFLPGEEIPVDETPEPKKKEQDLTDEEKEIVGIKGKAFASDLEQCVFDLYAEPDKHGKPAAGGKYKERFRMLTFNLSKRDRVVLHKRIASSHISAKELSTMSSTDLADEETKQSIKQAEQEALAHSILKKTTLPTAKITHKGLQDIEDMSGGASREREREQEREEEERIERERLARLKVQAQKAQQAAHANQQNSLPPESPTTPHSASWGGPPPLPLHILHSHDPGPSGRSPVDPLFVQTPSEVVASPVEGELNLADLINIDEEPSQDVAVSISMPPSTPPLPQSSMSLSGSTTLQSPIVQSQSTPTTVTGISPFAAKPSDSDPARRPSFDLNALWTLKDEPKQSAQQEDHPMDISPEAEAKPPPPAHEANTSGDAANDQDFDMFLEKEEEEHVPPPPPVANTPEAQRAAFEALPKIWTGKLSMPLDSTIPQEVSLIARQVGGRTLGHDSPLWRTLFPADHLRIDGRVAVDKSAQYLTQMRLNSTKELIAAALSPDLNSSHLGLDALSTHLIAKGRHGLIFPWGTRPKDHHPGRELYIVPLLSSEPIPDFMELLDNLQLPKIRNTSLLIGIWVLNKGKLAPPPLPSVITVPPMPTAQPPPVPQGVNLPIPIAVPSAPPLGTAPPAAATLASDIASLTPEQIQLMLRTISATAPIPAQPMVPALPPPQIPPQPVSLQPYTDAISGYPPAYPPPPSMHPNAHQPGPKPYQQPPPYDRYEQDSPMYSQDRPYDDYERGDRPRRGDRNGRGDRGYRGRSGGRNRNKPFDRPRDSGWKGRGRGRAGPSSPPRDDRWGGSPQRWG